MLPFVLNLLIVIYAFYFFISLISVGQLKKGFRTKGTLLLRKFHLLFLCLLPLLWFLATKDIYLRGYWTTKILGWCFFFSGLILFTFGKKQISSKIERIYYGFFFWLPIAFVPICLIPIFGWGWFSFINDQATGTKRDIFYNDASYRIQRTGNIFNSSTALFVKRGLLEYKQDTEIISHNFLNDMDYIRVHQISEDKLKIYIYYKGTFFTNNPSGMIVKLDN